MYLPAMKVLKNVIERMKVRQTSRSTSVVSVVSVVLVVSMVVLVAYRASTILVCSALGSSSSSCQILPSLNMCASVAVAMSGVVHAASWQLTCLHVFTSAVLHVFVSSCLPLADMAQNSIM